MIFSLISKMLLTSDYAMSKPPPGQWDVEQIQKKNKAGRLCKYARAQDPLLPKPMGNMLEITCNTDKKIRPYIEINSPCPALDPHSG